MFIRGLSLEFPITYWFRFILYFPFASDISDLYFSYESLLRDPRTKQDADHGTFLNGGPWIPGPSLPNQIIFILNWTSKLLQCGFDIIYFETADLK